MLSLLCVFLLLFSCRLFWCCCHFPSISFDSTWTTIYISRSQNKTHWKLLFWHRASKQINFQLVCRVQLPPMPLPPPRTNFIVINGFCFRWCLFSLFFFLQILFFILRWCAHVDMCHLRQSYWKLFFLLLLLFAIAVRTLSDFTCCIYSIYEIKGTMHPSIRQNNRSVSMSVNVFSYWRQVRLHSIDSKWFTIRIEWDFCFFVLWSMIDASVFSSKPQSTQIHLWPR